MVSRWEVVQTCLEPGFLLNSLKLNLWEFHFDHQASFDDLLFRADSASSEDMSLDSVMTMWMVDLSQFTRQGRFSNAQGDYPAEGFTIQCVQRRGDVIRISDVSHSSKVVSACEDHDQSLDAVICLNSELITNNPVSAKMRKLSNDDNDEDDNDNVGGKVGAVIVVILLIILLGIGLFLWRKRQNVNRDPKYYLDKAVVDAERKKSSNAFTSDNGDVSISKFPGTKRQDHNANEKKNSYRAQRSKRDSFDAAHGVEVTSNPMFGNRRTMTAAKPTSSYLDDIETGSHPMSIFRPSSTFLQKFINKI